MAFVQLQCAPWDKIYSIKTDVENLQLYGKVILKSENALDLARVIEISDEPYLAEEIDEKTEIVRLATDEDLAKPQPTEKEKQEAMSAVAGFIAANDLKMKLVDLRWSWDSNRLTVAFAAEGRVDFRQLVKDLSRHFNRNIRLQQIGIRDETKMVGDCGRCGRGLCCREHLAKFTQVSGEMAEVQSLGTRGSDRLSGACGRLMCCLSYEAEGYKEMADKMPPIGAKVNVDGQKGTVVGHHLLKNSVDVKFPGEKGERDIVLEVDLNRHKNKK